MRGEYLEEGLEHLEEGLEYLGEAGWSTWKKRGWSTWERGLEYLGEGVGAPGRGCIESRG